MQILQAAQGTDLWHAARAKHFCASEAAAAMGVSKYTTRSELLHQKATGLTEEVSPAKQRIFDAGHAAEAQARAIAESIAGKEFFPVVATLEVEGMPLLASFDGIDMMEDEIWENKLLNSSLVEQVQCAELEPHYWAQLEHQLLVSGAKRALFTTSDGTPEGTHHTWYESDPERRAQVIAAWKQFEADLAVYVPPVVTEKAVAKIVGSLPVVFDMRVEGKLISCNLAKYKPAALAYIEGINTELEDDQSFADAEADAKFCRESAEKLNLAIEQAIGQMGDVNEAMNTVREIAAAFDAKGLSLEKLVKNRKDQKRTEIVLTASAALKAHIAELSASIGKPLMPTVNADFAGVIKGKRSVETSQNAADTELARAKIEATGIADRIKANLATLAEHADKSALFPDVPSLALKQPDDLAAVITTRIATHEANEAQRKAREAQAQAEREAELIAQKAREDAAKAVAEAEAKAKADYAAEANAQREAAAAAIADQVEQPLALVQQPATVDEMHQIGEGIRNWPEPDSGAMLRLGEINERLKPMSITADGLAQLGLTPAGTERASKLYRESDLPKICDALIRVLVLAKNPQLATA